MSFTHLSLDQLNSKRNGLLIAINAEKMKSKNSFIKIKSKKLEELEYTLKKVEEEIAKRQSSTVKMGLKTTKSPTSSFSVTPQAQPFQPSVSSSFQPTPQPSVSVTQPFNPPAPSPVVRPVAPVTATPFVPPSTVQITPYIPPSSKPQLPQGTQPKTMPSVEDTFDTYEVTSRPDYWMLIEENKALIGIGALIGLYFVFGRKKPKKSNPKRKRKSTKRRSNRKRRGYNRH